MARSKTIGSTAAPASGTPTIPATPISLRSRQPLAGATPKAVEAPKSTKPTKAAKAATRAALRPQRPTSAEIVAAAAKVSADAAATGLPGASKQFQVIAALRSCAGATIPELMQLTGWLSHSVRGLISGNLKRKLGLIVDSAVEPARGRVYRIPPEPQDTPRQREGGPGKATTKPAPRRKGRAAPAGDEATTAQT